VLLGGVLLVTSVGDRVVAVVEAKNVQELRRVLPCLRVDVTQCIMSLNMASSIQSVLFQ